MYFATLTEVPILEGLLGSGMGRGPALTLLLAGPAVSLPSILVLRSIMGGRKTAVFIALVVVLSAVTGFIFGNLWSRRTRLEIRILGTGCAKCDKLEKETRLAAEELGSTATSRRCPDVQDIMAYGVMITPALVVDGEVKVVGKVPARDEIKKLLT